MKVFDTAIIGLGPTGATLANLLAMQGLSVLVLERESQIYNLPRAVHFDDEIMRVFQNIGIADELLPLVRVNPGMKFVDSDNNLLLDWPRPQEITPQGWNASYRLHQPDLERLLRKRLESYDNVLVKTGGRVASIDQTGTSVELLAHSVSTDTSEKYRAQYVIGCDGANSQTRTIIQSELDDYGFQERWLVIDLILKKPRPDLGDHSIQFCLPDRPMTYCRGPGKRRRWEITLMDSEDEEYVTKPDHIWSLLRPWITSDEAELERRAVYTFKSQVAREWRRGRIFLAGDAAHVTPPFLGQGMCIGIRDAFNLAWKLGSVINQEADSSLLESYEDERSSHARAYVKMAIKIGQIIHSVKSNNVLTDVSEHQTASGELRSIAPKLGSSSLTATQPDSNTNVEGRPAPQFRIQPGNRLLDDVSGYRHVIISDTRPVGLKDGVFWINPRRQSEASSLLEDLEIAAAWIRPDRYMGATTKSMPELYKRLPKFLKTNEEYGDYNETSIS